MKEEKNTLRSTHSPGALFPLNAPVPNAWAIRDTAFGGAVFFKLIKAMEACAEQPLRSFECTLPRPLKTGVPFQLSTDVLSQGKRSGFLSAQMRQGDEVVAHAHGVVGVGRDTACYAQNWSVPKLPQWSDVPVMDTAFFPPRFLQCLEMRPCLGTRPSETGEPRGGGYVRSRIAPDRFDAAYAALLLDAWYPSILNRGRPTQIVTTITMSISFHPERYPHDPTKPVLVERRAIQIAEGYCSEIDMLVDLEGQVLGVAHQSLVLVR